MPSNIEINSTEIRLFNPTVSVILGLIFTLPVACILQAFNWKILNNYEKYRQNIIFCTVWLILVSLHNISVCLLYINQQTEIARFMRDFGGLMWQFAGLLIWLLMLGKNQCEFVDSLKTNNTVSYKNRHLYAVVFLSFIWILLFVIYFGLLGKLTWWVFA
ncbi:MAG: hypothetical protein IJ566_03110 [Cardiobacteriaceae bacterium]|nr:hypothetical protein [Cardiobacteriaceae bacterium]